MQLKIVTTLLILFYTNSLSAKVLGLKDILQMTTGTTLMPTILPTYVTIQYNAPRPDAYRIKFIKDNFDDLKEDIAKGEGEHLETLSQIYLVQKKDEWKLYLQTHFDEIYTDSKSKKESAKVINDITYDKFINLEYYEVEDSNGTYGVEK